MTQTKKKSGSSMTTFVALTTRAAHMHRSRGESERGDMLVRQGTKTQEAAGKGGKSEADGSRTLRHGKK